MNDEKLRETFGIFTVIIGIVALILWVLVLFQPNHRVESVYPVFFDRANSSLIYYNELGEIKHIKAEEAKK